MTAYAKPLPAVNEETRPYWESAKAHRLALQRCSACGKFRYPVTTYCPACLSDTVEWTPVSGRGVVYSFIIMHQVYHPAFKDDVPYNVAAVEFEEGPRTYTNIVGCANDAIRVGMPVTIEYDDVTDEVTLVKFRPAE
ncbi:MAG: Zn-ribbon domain-containing OB-fold protein [Dehalococcoidia bacterium]